MIKILLLFLISSNSLFSKEVERFSLNANSKNTGYAISGQLLVKISSENYSNVLDKMKKYGYKISSKIIDSKDIYLVEFSTGVRLSSSIKYFKDLGVEAYPNRVYKLHKTPNDSYLSSQYYLQKISAYSAWGFDTGFKSTVTIAIIDSGVDASHKDLLNKVVDNKYITSDGLYGPYNNSTVACFHGTAVAGVSAANTDNNLGIAGVSWGAKIISIKIFDDDSCEMSCDDKSLTQQCSTSDLAIYKAINYVENLNQNVYGKIIVNLSLGDSSPCSTLLQDEINDAYSKGIIIVASAGNDMGAVNSPANCQNAIAVSATDEKDNIAYFSSRGSDMLNGVSAPGVNVYTLYPEDRYGYFDGTSFSAPIVSGLLALMWDYRPDYSNAQLINVLKTTADDLGDKGPDYLYGNGRVNAYRAILFLTDSAQSKTEDNKVKVFPNPFYVSKDKFVNFYVPANLIGNDLKIQIYSFNGDFIKEIHNFVWDGKNDAGAYVASGPYIVFVKSDRGKAKGKFVLIK